MPKYLNTFIRKYPRLLTALLFLAVLLPAVYFTLNKPSSKVEAGWFDSNWTYRKRIPISSHTSSESNVYITISNYNASDTSRYQTDCGDMRFTRQNGELLPYYVSSCGASTTIHINFDVFPAGAQDIYIYYGNPAAENGFSSSDFSTEATNYTLGTIASEETTPGPVAYWKFDEGTGSTAHDAAGVNHGSINGATWTSEDQCVSGKCLSFDGTNDYVDMGNTANLSGAVGITISTWVKPSSISATNFEPILFRGDSNSTKAYSLYLHHSDEVRFKITTTSTGSSSSVALDTTSSPIGELNRWYHIIATYSDTDDTMRIYVDGRVVQSSNSLASGTLLDGANNLDIGRGSAGAPLWFPGLIDEVKIFPYALTEEQIKTEYNLGAAAVMGTGPGVAPPAGGTLNDSLVAHWAFDEQYGQTAHDKVGNNHGTFGASTSPGSDDPTWTAAGECKVNGCLGFDGGDYIQPSTSEPFKITSKSVTFWGNLTSIPNTFRLSVGGNSSNWYTGFASNGRMISSHVNSTWSQRVTYSSTNILTDNTWDHYAYTWDVNGSIVTVRLYKNGKLVGSDDFADGYSSAYGSLFILGALSPSSAFFQGKLDELKIYNVALTADQVKQDMNAGASIAYSVGSEEADELADGAGAPPIAEWKLDDKQGGTASDTSGNKRDGSITGAIWKSSKDCHQGACLEFDGVDDYLQMPSVTVRSISMWIYINSNSEQTPSAWNYLFDGRIGGANTYYADKGVGSAWSKQYVNGVSTTVTYSAIPKDQWIHLYLEASSNFTDDIAFMSSYNFYENLKAKLDDVKIYDYARTPAQIAYDYNRGAPVAWYKFDECQGTTANDSSGNNNQGTLSVAGAGGNSSIGTCNTVSSAWGTGAAGKYNASLYFDGTEDMVEMTNASILGTTSNLSIAAWVKTGDSSSSIYGEFTSDGSQTRNFLCISSGKLQFDQYNPSGGYLTSDTSVNTDQWVHVAYVQNGSNRKMYINGVLDKEDNSAETYTGTAPTASRIGRRGSASESYTTNGRIDDVRIYNYPLSSSQVKKIMNEGAAMRFGD